jgi:hypothetical protein
MKQILHIFAKDVRRFWPEILISLAITAAFVGFYPAQWFPRRLSPPDPIAERLVIALPFLVPVGWWLLITRLIHAERLVGDKQFWLTRPYEWWKLLTAKLLFLACFLYLPFFIAQSLLLVAAGFHPLFYIPTLFYNLLIITGIFVLPLVALAAVTSSFARMTLTILGFFLGYIGFVIPVAYHVNTVYFTVSSKFNYPLALILFMYGVAVVVQYALRKAWIARLLLIAYPVLFVCFFALFPEPSQSSIDQTYPQPASTADAPIQLSYASDALDQLSATKEYFENQVGIRIPLKPFGIAEGFAVVPNGLRVSIESPSGSRWISPWEPANVTNFLPESKAGSLYFKMPRAVYDKLKSEPLSMRITVVLTQVQAVNTTRISLPAHEFSVPEFGTCSTIKWKSPYTGLTCFSPVRQPPLTYVSVAWSNSFCTASHSESDTGVQGAGWSGSLNQEIVPFGILPVLEFGIYPSNIFQDERSEHPRFLCPGSPVIFTQYKLVRRAQTSIPIQDFHLPALP